MYDPKVGRWLSEDPIGFDGGDSNFARYVSNKPISLTDPFGLESPQMNPTTSELDFVVKPTLEFQSDGPKEGTSGPDAVQQIEKEWKPLKAEMEKNGYTASLTSLNTLRGQTKPEDFIIGQTVYAVFTKAKTKYDPVTKSCDWAGTEVIIQPMIFSFMKNAPKYKIHLGGGRLVNGPATNLEHEQWHVSGIPDSVLDTWNLTEESKKRIKSELPGGVAGVKQIINGIFKDVNKPEELRLNAILNDTVEDQCKSMKDAFSRIPIATVTTSGNWHVKSTDKGAKYDLSVKGLKFK